MQRFGMNIFEKRIVRQVGHLQESLDNFLVGFYTVLKSRGKKTVSIYEASKASQEKKEINNS
jgi:hypothetical protein